MYDSSHTCLKGGQRSFFSYRLSPGSNVDMPGKAGTAMVGEPKDRGCWSQRTEGPWVPDDLLPTARVQASFM